MSSTKIFDISLTKMQTAFEKMEHEAGGDTKGQLFWGYYFLDHDLYRLEEFAKKLKNTGFVIVEIKNTGNNNLYLLHTEEHMVHSAQSLHEQCHKLAKLANENKIEIFDGWDVGQIEMSKGLVD